MAEETLSYNLAEAQRILGIGRTKLRDLLNSGDLPARKLGGRTVILRADIEKLLEKAPPYQRQGGI